MLTLQYMNSSLTFLLIDYGFRLIHKLPNSVQLAKLALVSFSVWIFTFVPGLFLFRESSKSQLSWDLSPMTIRLESHNPLCIWSEINQEIGNEFRCIYVTTCLYKSHTSHLSKYTYLTKDFSAMLLMYNVSLIFAVSYW